MITGGLRIGGIEAGGTKFVVGVGSSPADLVTTQVLTTSPAETLAKVCDWLEDQGPVAALGIASFGPVDLRPGSATYGHITTTPKPGWANTDLVGDVRRRLAVPVAFDTDVNGAALGEWCWGAGQGLSDVVYLTVGTGIGGGALVGGRLLHGLLHPEMGHMRVLRHPHDRFPGACPFHGDCLEGLASGPALAGRWGRPGEQLADADEPVWEVEAHYLAHAVANLVCTLSPQRVILGGSVMRRQALFPLVRRRVQRLLAGYVQAPELVDGIDAFIVPPALGDRAGVLGAIALGVGALEAAGPVVGTPG